MVAATGSTGLDEAYALLFVSRQEKTVLGPSMVGDTLVRNARHTAVSFTGHRVFAPRPIEEAARRSLMETLFDGIVDYVMVHMARLRHGPPVGAGADPETGRSLNNPAVYLEVLTGILSEPENLLRLQTNVIRINRLGS